MKILINAWIVIVLLCVISGERESRDCRPGLWVRLADFGDRLSRSWVRLAGFGDRPRRAWVRSADFGHRVAPLARGETPRSGWAGPAGR